MTKVKPKVVIKKTLKPKPAAVVEDSSLEIHTHMSCSQEMPKKKREQKSDEKALKQTEV